MEDKQVAERRYWKQKNFNINKHRNIIVAWILIITLFCNIAMASVCPNTMTNSNAIRTKLFNFSESSKISTWGIIVGPVSNDLYFLFRILIAPQVFSMGIVRQSSSSLVWRSVFPYSPLLNSIQLDSSELNVYVAAIK